MAAGKEIGIALALPFILNLVFNLAFTPIQFGLKNNLLAAIDILLVLATLIWSMLAIFPFVHWVTYINIPYFTWVCIATVLQLTITKMNWNRK
jgi:tryptophan-rich sensory protein